MVMALHVTGGKTIDRRGGKSTGGIAQEANHPGVRPMVEPKPRSEGTGVKTLEQKWAQSAGTLDYLHVDLHVLYIASRGQAQTAYM